MKLMPTIHEVMAAKRKINGSLAVQRGQIACTYTRLQHSPGMDPGGWEWVLCVVGLMGWTDPAWCLNQVREILGPEVEIYQTDTGCQVVIPD